ncbi:MAG: NAD-binding protein [Fodinibius sp.]|nr:NAD-binding protein [Fodinibius sp.]
MLSSLIAIRNAWIKFQKTLTYYVTREMPLRLKILLMSGVKDADIMIAVTSIDEVNMIASMMSKRLGTQMVIARVRSDELSRPNAPLKPSDIGDRRASFTRNRVQHLKLYGLSSEHQPVIL